MFRYKSLLIVIILFSGLLIMPFHLVSVQESTTHQDQPSDEVVWQRYLEWLRNAPQADSPSAFYLTYQSYLKSTGVSPDEIKRQAAVVGRIMKESPDGWRTMFNNIYQSSNPEFETQPNTLLVSTVEGRKPGSALDIGMGQGRNSLFLALKGWDVTGFDVSDEGLEAARRNAERADVKLNAVHESDESFDYGSDRWDLIVFVYNPLPVTSTAWVERLHKSLKAGGLIVIESHATDPRLPTQLPTVIEPATLLAAFKDFRILHFEDITGKPDWMAEMTDRIVRMVAEKWP